MTICAKNKGNIFGEMRYEKVNLNGLGKIVEQQWQWLFKRYRYLKFDEWVIMPDHIHGIMVIENEIIVGNGRENDENVGNGRDRSVQEKIKSISELIGAFKTTSSRLIHLSGYKDFVWHKSFYDEIIRDEKSLNRIRRYIIENPKNYVLKSK